LPTTNGVWLALLVIVNTGVATATTVKLTGPEPVPPLTCVVVTALTLLGCVPATELVTVISTVHPPGATFGTVRFKALAPRAKAGELVTLAHVPPITVDATLILVSKSVKLALFTMPVLVLPNANRMVLVPPLLILGCKKLLLIVTGDSGGAVTIKLADAVALVFALVEVTVPVVLTIPGEVATKVLVTLTAILHAPVPAALNGTVAPVMLNDVSLAALPAVTVPPQELLNPGVAVTFMPDGKMSLHTAPVIAWVVDGLLIVKVIIVAVLATMVLGANDFVTAGAANLTASNEVAATAFAAPCNVVSAPTGMVLV
jgi:hypothetical protein